MTTAMIDRTLERLRHQAEEHAELAEALEFLADAGSADDPFGRVEDGVMRSVQAIDRRRHRDHRQDLRERSLITAEVVAMVESISDRKGVDRRRQRGRLLGIKDANVVRHPMWQFDRDLGETRPGLDRVLAALGEVTADPVAADALMTAPRSDLGGGTLAGLLAGGDVALVVGLIHMAGDQS